MQAIEGRIIQTLAKVCKNKNVRIRNVVSVNSEHMEQNNI